MSELPEQEHSMNIANTIPTASHLQSQSPISVSGSDSVSGTTPVPIATNSINGVNSNILPNSNAVRLSIDQVFSEEQENNTMNDDNKMDIDKDGDGKEINNELELDTEIKDNGSAKREADDSIRTEKLMKLYESLENMENLRLELIPLLLGVVEQVKNGEIPIKDVDNACGRIRVRIGKLEESRTWVESELCLLENKNRGADVNQPDPATRIRIKAEGISRVMNAITSRKIFDNL